MTRTPTDKPAGWLRKLALAASVLLPAMAGTAFSQQTLDAEVSMEAAVHTGAFTPFWQVSNRHGLASIDNYGYARAALSYKNQLTGNWRLEAEADLVAGLGTDRNFIVQQAYADVYFKWLGLSVGSKERSFEQLNPLLSSGGLVWSGNARPIPQVRLGAFDYVPICRRFAMKAEVSFGWFTDGAYLSQTANESESYVKGIKFHTKNFYMRIGDPLGHWVWEMGYRMDTQFGGTQYLTDGEKIVLGSGIKQYWQALIPQSGGEASYEGEQIAYAGNHMGSELLKLSYQWKGKRISAYMENYFDDFSGMGKLNGFDGLWGIEYHDSRQSHVEGIVFEYYQSTNQSGPLHGVDNDPLCLKTGGADDYYNNFIYPGWTHWGHSIGSPLAVSPMYNDDGTLSFKHNRVKAFHLGINGRIVKDFGYRLLMTHSRSWGTVFQPTIDVMRNFSFLAEAIYAPSKLEGWEFKASIAADFGDLYGDNAGLQLSVKKAMNILRRQ